MLATVAGGAQHPVCCRAQYPVQSALRAVAHYSCPLPVWAAVTGARAAFDPPYHLLLLRQDARIEAVDCSPALRALALVLADGRCADVPWLLSDTCCCCAPGHVHRGGGLRAGAARAGAGARGRALRDVPRGRRRPGARGAAGLHALGLQRGLRRAVRAHRCAPAAGALPRRLHPGLP